MSWKTRLFFFLLPALLLTKMAAIERDHQLWLLALYERPLAKPWRLHFLAEGRWKEGGSKLHQKIIEIEAIYPFNKWFEVAPGYRNDWGSSIIEPFDNNESHIPYIDFYLHLRQRKEHIRNRLRPQYVIREKGKNFWLVRDRITWFLPPILPKKMDLVPYLQDEVFWHEFGGIFENRIYAGATFLLKRCLRGGIFFMHRVIHAERGWRQDEVIGLQLHYIFTDRPQSSSQARRFP